VLIVYDEARIRGASLLMPISLPRKERGIFESRLEIQPDLPRVEL
jgi:hypothetical protein